MPEALPQGRAWAEAEFGSIDALPVLAWLKERGYVLREDWQWELPRATYIPTGKEMRAIAFLIDEWDFGGILIQPGSKS